MKYNVNDLIYLCNHIDRYPNFRIDIELLLRGKSLKKVLADDKVVSLTCNEKKLSKRKQFSIFY